MLFLKILIFPIYIPIAIIVGILKMIGIVSFMNDVIDFFDQR